jgi:hypothetical protein
MTRYLVGEVDGVLYWHEIDEEGTKELRQELEVSGHPSPDTMCKTTHGLVFGSTPHNSIPELTSHSIYNGK